MKLARLFRSGSGTAHTPAPASVAASQDSPRSDTPPTGQEVPESALRARVIDALRQVYDPEIPVNIYDLGLIYDLDMDAQGRVSVRMTLTAPACPVAQSFPARVAAAIEAVDGVDQAEVELVWEPPWDIRRASEAARLQLGFFP